MKTGVVGFGVAAQFMHLPFIVTNPDFQLRKILQRHGDTAKEKYPDVEIVRSLEEMLADESLELIVITTPNDSHFHSGLWKPVNMWYWRNPSPLLLKMQEN